MRGVPGEPVARGCDTRVALRAPAACVAGARTRVRWACLAVVIRRRLGVLVVDRAVAVALLAISAYRSVVGSTNAVLTATDLPGVVSNHSIWN